jgi:hypothetical protein
VKTLARERDKEEILVRLRAIRPESRRRWGRMSAHQMLCHLADSFRMLLGGRAVRPTTGLPQRTLLKWTVLYAPLRWPAGIVTSPEIDQEREGTRPVGFEADVAQVEALLDEVTARTRDLHGRSHPVFGRMSDGAWLRWAYLHTDHHLRQFGV